MILVGQSIVNSWYNGLVVCFRQPFSHGFETMINYTYSKSIDDGAVAGQYGTFYGTDDSAGPLQPKARKTGFPISISGHRLVGA